MSKKRNPIFLVIFSRYLLLFSKLALLTLVPAILSCWFFKFILLLCIKVKVVHESLHIYLWIGQISFRKRETRSNWTQEIRGLQNHRKHWWCFRSRKLFLVFRKWASTGTRAVSDSQEDLWVVLANTHLRCLRKPWLVLLCLPDRSFPC